MSEPSKIKQSKLSLQFNLATLLLVTALCGSSMAYFLARSNRARLTTKMNALANLDNWLPVSDVATYSTNIEVANDESFEIWVPRHGCLKLCWSTSVGENFVAEAKPIELREGRHAIVVRVLKFEALILVDNQVVFNRRYSRDWNIAQPVEWASVGEQVLSAKKSLIMSAPGVVTLRSDEPFDPTKHRYGLKIWLER